MKSDKTSRHGAREGFEAFDPAQVGGLSDAQREAIARAVVAQGPTLIRQGNTHRMLAKVAFGSSLAAAAALVFMLRSREPEESQPTVAAVGAAPACGADAAPTPITHEGEDRSTIEIGTAIVAVAPRDTQVSIVQASPCVTQLALRDGTLTVRARNLRGGSVLVDTLHGQIRAEGAFMRIATLASSTSISVVEGEVVMRSAAGAEKVAAGRSIKVNREGVERAALSDQERKNVLGAFDAPEASAQPAQDAGTKSAVAARNPRVRPTQPSPQKVRPEPEPALSATELLAQADALWRKGDYTAARQAFRTAAKDPGTIGEAAWVRLARLELSAGSSEQALSALKARKSRGGQGTLGAEALWLEAQALDRVGRGAEARATAQTLLRDYPSSPQAAAAKRLVAKGSAP